MFITATWQLVVLQAVSGLTLGGLIPSAAALMNRYAPEGSQGATYGLDNSVQAAGRVVAPLAAAGLAALIGYRGVFLGTTLVYGVAAAVALAVLHTLTRRRVAAPAADPPP
jgi:DHA1 family multidrug resistance protein-like MFS transporter